MIPDLVQVTRAVCTLVIGSDETSPMASPGVPFISPAMSNDDLTQLLTDPNVAPWRIGLARVLESTAGQYTITTVILLNALILGLETDAGIMADWGGILIFLDTLCLGVFVVELLLRFAVYRRHFWVSGWNWFDLLVVLIALVPGTGPFSVLRSLRVLRVLRLLTVLPGLKRVITAFLHALPGLGGVLSVLAVFFYVAAVLTTNLFGETHPQWFGSMGASLFTLFQVMTLESWSMGVVRPLMEEHPWAWLFFVPFIVLATFTILNLFIGIIVSTMQELGRTEGPVRGDLLAGIERIETELESLRRSIAEHEGRQSE